MAVAIVGLRACRKCGTLFSTRCRECVRANHEANADRIAAKHAEWKAANADAIRERARARYAKNAEQISEANARRRQENPDKFNARYAAWAAANPEKKRASFAAWAAANPEKRAKSLAEYREKNAERVAETRAVWNASNPDKVRVHKVNRRLRELGGQLSPGLPKILYKLQRGKCACCGEPLGDEYHLDHILPLALGGTNTDDNIQLLRPKCNSQKHAKHPVDFMQSRGFLL